jgi:hypothetical protein
MSHYEIEPEMSVQQEIDAKHVNVNALVNEAEKYIDEPDVDDTAMARMFIERGYSEDLSYWLVRLAEVRHAPDHR